MDELFQCPLENSSSSSNQPFKNVLANLLFSLLIYSILGFVFYLFFECNRINSLIFDSRRLQQPSSTPLRSSCWINLLCTLSDDSTIQKGHINLDFYVILRLLSVCTEICIFSTLISFIVLVPVYATAGSPVDGFSSFTMDNLDQKSPRLWAPSISYCLVKNFH